MADYGLIVRIRLRLVRISLQNRKKCKTLTFSDNEIFFTCDISLYSHLLSISNVHELDKDEIICSSGMLVGRLISEH